MTTTLQTEAMRLADWLDADAYSRREAYGLEYPELTNSASELRRLDAVEAENVRLKELIAHLAVPVGHELIPTRELNQLRAQVERLRGGEPIGYINAGHLHEMECGRLSYTYLYPKHVVGASVHVYTAQPAAPTQTDEQGRPMTYWGGLAEKPAAPALASHIEVLKARLNESNGILEAFKFQCQTAAFQLKENQAAIDSAPALVPLTPQQMFHLENEHPDSMRMCSFSFRRGIESAERAHGIGQPAGGDM